MSRLAGKVAVITGAASGQGAVEAKLFAKNLGPDHIRVNSVHPGFIQTPMISNFTENEEVKKQLISQIPLQYLGNPEDVAFAALFLASDESRFITGEELIIDGGQSIKE